jgi:hypothetical protein
MSSGSQPIKKFKNALQCLLRNSIFMELKPKVVQLPKTVKCYYIFSAPYDQGIVSIKWKLGNPKKY